MARIHRRLLAPIISLTLSGCAAMGAPDFSATLTELKSMPPEVLDRLSACQAVQATADGRGVYTQGTITTTTSYELNGGCSNVKSLNKAVPIIEYNQ